MSPIFVRPVREQLEHDRLIRYVQGTYQRKFEVAVNMGDEQVAPVKIGSATFYPDVVLTAGRKLAGLVEVETGESVNNLEAMAQWVHFARARVPFYLYVPVHGYDAARRLLDANQVKASEVWTYRLAPEGFDLVRMYVSQSPGARRAGKSETAGKAKPKTRAAKTTTATRGSRAAKAPARRPSGRAKSAGSGKAAAAPKARPTRSSSRLASARKKAATGTAKNNSKKVSAGRRR